MFVENGYGSGSGESLSKVFASLYGQENFPSYEECEKGGLKGGQDQN